MRRKDIDREWWTWDLCRRTTTAPGGLLDKGKRRRVAPLIPEIRNLDVIGLVPMARPFTGPQDGRITTAVLRDATHWDEVVVEFGYEHLHRHHLRHTGLTWMADAGVLLQVLWKIAGHRSLSTAQRYLHPDLRSIELAGEALSAHLTAGRETAGPQLVPTAPGVRHLRLVK